MIRFRNLSAPAPRRLALILGIGCIVGQAQAVPSFARQTGQECAACHVGGFGPQLTPYGQRFKLSGYTMKGGQQSDFNLPVAAMVVGNYEHTDKSQPMNAGPHDGTNNNYSLQEASLFLAGGFTDNLGTFIQTTYSDIDRKVILDNVDIRYAFTTQFAGANTIFGVSINNNPTNQDPWNTVPAWRFPYMSADLAPAPTGDPLIAGGLAQQAMGMTGYGYWNDHVYAEVGAYVTPSTGFLKTTNAVKTAADVAEIDGYAPYWRVAYNMPLHQQNATVGLFGMNADINPGRIQGPSNQYDDLGVDASYQFLGTGLHMFAVNTSYIHEKEKLDADFFNGNAARSSNGTNSFNLNGSYYFAKTYGLTLAYFDNSGSKTDTTLYAPSPFDGSRTGHSDSSGYVIQADWTPFGKEDSWGAPFANVRIGAQYTIYDKYNGSSKNYDGFGRNASDNNTLMLMIWTAM